jgi:hypothetical protein
MKSKYIGGLVLVLSAILSAPIAQATPITSSDFGSDATIINFNDTALVGQYITNQYQTQGVVFSGDSFTGPGGVISFLAPTLLNVTGVTVVQFSGNVDMVGLDYQYAPPSQEIVLEAYGSSGLIETVTSQPGATTGFLGLNTEGQMISYVRIHDSGFTFYIDNFTFADPVADPNPPVPEPSTLILLGSSFVGLFLGRKKFRTKG